MKFCSAGERIRWGDSPHFPRASLGTARAVPAAVWLLFLCVQAWAADLRLENGRVWTGDAAHPWARSVAITGNRISGVDTTEKAARVIDLQGKLVVPGFNDAHIHFLEGSLGLTQVNLTGVCTLESIQQKVREFVAAHPQAEWITGRGWEYSCFPGNRLPAKEDLDAAVRDKPAFLIAYDGHTGWANSKALRIGEVTAASKTGGFGEVVLNERGEPSGTLKEGAQALVKRHVPPATREQKLEALRQGMKMAARLGITSFQNASGNDDEAGLYDALPLTLRVSMALSVLPQMTQQNVELARPKNPRVRAAKFMMDGVIESHTAAMLEPYSDGSKTAGDPAWKQAEFNRQVAMADKLGLQVYTHAIGDRAVRMALDGYENALRVNGPHDARFRIEHIETVSATDIPRFAKLGVMPSMEPIHADPDSAEVWSNAVGPLRLPLAFAWRAFEKAGARLVFSSDWPASISVDPIRGIHCAVNRMTVEGVPKGGWVPEQKINVESALRGYTADAAYAEFAEKTKGTIAKGMLADVAVLSQDLFRVDPREIYKTKVVLTVFDGRVVFEGL